jgi:hypothetical protein
MTPRFSEPRTRVSEEAVKRLAWQYRLRFAPGGLIEASIAFARPRRILRVDRSMILIDRESDGDPE